MSKRENHWYILGSVVDGVGKARPSWVWIIGAWFVLIVAGFIAFQFGVFSGPVSGSTLRLLDAAASPLGRLLFFVAILAVVFGIVFILRARARASLVKALASPTPDAAIACVERAMRAARAAPDVDALTAQSKAYLYALYGREEDATKALGAIDWRSRAPLVQSSGVGAESAIAMLCRRDAHRALDLARQARVMATVSALVPGAAQSARSSDAYIAVAEALLGIESSASVKALEESAANARLPLLRLIASFGLAAHEERLGDLDRARQLRAFIEQTAPHCSPLHLRPDQFRAVVERGDAPSLVSERPTPGAHERAAKRKVLRSAGLLIGGWLVLFASLYVLQRLFAK